MPRNLTIFVALVFVLASIVVACTNGSRGHATAQSSSSPAPQPTMSAVINPMPVVHVFVALCDNVNQGIVPVSATLGNGDNAATNLYWGAAFGVKTFFTKSKDWELVREIPNPQPLVLDRCIFKHRRQNVFLIADAYRGKEIAQATLDFLEAAAGKPGEVIELQRGSATVKFNSGGDGDLLVYVGHDGLMDFTLKGTPQARDLRRRKTIILACASKQYFAKVLKPTGATALVWTTNLMAPEAYILSAALDGWLAHESDEQIRGRAAQAYNKYQHCGPRSADALFATGW